MEEIKLYMQHSNFELMYAYGNTNRKYQYLKHELSFDHESMHFFLMLASSVPNFCNERVMLTATMCVHMHVCVCSADVIWVCICSLESEQFQEQN